MFLLDVVNPIAAVGGLALPIIACSAIIIIVLVIIKNKKK